MYVGLGGTSQSPLYLGTCENIPGHQVSRFWDAVRNDLAGSGDPFDYIFEGVGQAFISLVLTNLNYAVLNLVDTLPSAASAGTISPPGSHTLSDVGSLMGQEGLAFPLWLRYQFGASLANKVSAYPLLPSGRFYPQCLLWGPDNIESGSRAMKQHRVFLAWKQYLPAAQTFMLYDESPVRFVGLPAPM